jgi:choline transport protein
MRVGWVTVFVWQATITSLSFLLAGQLQGVVVLNNPSYVPERWHTTLLMWAVVLISFVQNIWGIRLLPALEFSTSGLHILLFLVLFVIVLVMGRNASAEFVFTSFVNQTGWDNDGVAWFIGLLPCIWCVVGASSPRLLAATVSSYVTGFDGVIHLSEETERSAHDIPKVIAYTVLINCTMALGYVLLCLFSISDIPAALSTVTGYPLIEIMRQVTGSRECATAIYAFILAITFASMFGTLASVSRLTQAFAQDGKLLFSNYVKHVGSKHKVPGRAVGLVSIVIVLLSLINLGSSTALSAILSLSTIALYTSYIVSGHLPDLHAAPRQIEELRLPSWTGRNP